ncbi:rho GTPase-activating protein 8-like isoform X2 [Danio rerio]|uniref:Rho GTPase-activating protein 8-like isoform X2 n=1 Tax=Danio rerio TaxID=7955 RepID=A0AB32TWZ3_DANRE
MGVLSVCEEAPSKVFGVSLSHLRKTGQMRQGLPLAFTHLVGFLEKHVFRLSKRHKAVKKILDTIPEENYNILCFLTFFLSRVAAESHANRMTTTNLSIEFGPILFHVPQGPTKLEEEEMCISFTEYMLDNLRHLLPNMYPQASATNMAEGDSVSEAGGDFTPEKCVQQVLLTETSSKPPKIGRLERLRRRFLHFWQKFGSRNGRRKVEDGEQPSGAGDVQCKSPQPVRD